MFIAWDLFDAHPTEKGVAPPTDHFVTPIYLLDGESAFRTLLCALLDVIEVESFLDLLNILLRNFTLLLVFHLQSRALLKKVVFLLTGNAVLEVAPRTHSKVFSIVDLSWRATLLDRTPPEILHFLDRLVDREYCKFINQFFVKSALL